MSAAPQNCEVTYVEPDGKRRIVRVSTGQSVMQGAVGNQIRGIDAICSGSGACGTCHVYLEPPWDSKAGIPGSVEAAMLECVADPRPNSRLSCQVQLTPELDGLIVHIPETQQ